MLQLHACEEIWRKGKVEGFCITGHWPTRSLRHPGEGHLAKWGSQAAGGAAEPFPDSVPILFTCFLFSFPSLQTSPGRSTQMSPFCGPFPEPLPRKSLQTEAAQTRCRWFRATCCRQEFYVSCFEQSSQGTRTRQGCALCLRQRPVRSWCEMLPGRAGKQIKRCPVRGPGCEKLRQ